MTEREPLLTPRFVALWLYAFVTFFSAFQLLPAIPFRILELGGSKGEAGWFLCVYGYSSAFAAPLMGSLADGIGRRLLLIIASILFIVFSIGYGVITNLPLLLVVGAIHGAIWSGLIASASAIMSEYIPASRRSQGLAYWGLASTGAIAVAPAVGLWVFRFGWLTLCVELATLSILMTVGAFFIRPLHGRSSGPSVALGEAWDWRVIRTALSLTVATFGYGGVTTYTAIIAIERHIKPASIYLTVFAVTIVFYRVFFAHLGDRIGFKAVLYPSLALIPIAFAVLAIAQQRWQKVLSAILFGIGMGASYPAFAAFILGNTDSDRRARTFGSIVWAFDTGIATGSLVIGVLAEHLGFAFAFKIAAALSCFSIPIFASASRHLAARGTSLAADFEHGRTD